jgi:hypothetical protein
MAEGRPSYSRRMINVNDTAAWDWAIKTAKSKGLSVGKFIEHLFREQIQKETSSGKD